MKGISLCADCAYYNLKKHKCNRSAKSEPELSKGDDVRFYADCPLPDVEPVNHGSWVDWSMWGESRYQCSECNCEMKYKTNFCPRCGARMDGGAENG